MELSHTHSNVLVAEKQPNEVDPAAYKSDDESSIDDNEYLI